MRRGLVLVIFLLSAIIVSTILSCVNNSEEDLYGLVVCDTSDLDNVTWEYPIRQLVQKHCVYCHNEDENYGEPPVRHDTYEEELKVVYDGRLRRVVNHEPGYVQMPYQLPKLGECELTLINTWIDNGAPEN